MNYFFTIPEDEEKVILNFAVKGFLRALTYYPNEDEDLETFVTLLLVALDLLNRECEKNNFILTNNTDIFYSYSFSGFLYGFILGAKTHEFGFPDKEKLFCGDKKTEEYYSVLFRNNWKKLQLYSNYLIVCEKKYFKDFLFEIKNASVPELDKCIEKRQEIFLSEEKRKKAIYSEWKI